ncbi:hypothetical protein AB7C87_07555 [Natrarchaeobius sp. A-rgal3]|uniref:hypothetical protein n=1 Tax=Natrarchaeobius versutus TaxID=1679078 RepID=UPI00350EE506
MDKFKIDIDYGDEFRTSVTDGSADPYTGIRIVANDTYLYGTTDRWPKNWVVYIVNSLLEACSQLVDNDKVVITNHNGPSYFVLEPEGHSKIRVTNVLQYDGIDDPSQRLPEAESDVVKTSSIIDESIRTGEELLEQITDCNPELTDDSDIELLRTNLEDARLAAKQI